MQLVSTLISSDNRNSPASTPTAASETPLATSIVRGGASVALSSYFLFAFGFASNLVLTRLLAPADFGVFALGTFFFALLNLRPKSGIDQAFVHHLATDALSSGTLASLSVATGLASLLLTLIAAPVLSAFGYSQSVVIVTLALAGVGVMDSIMGIAWVQLDKALFFTRTSLVTALVFPLSYLPAFYLAFTGGGYWALVAQNVAYAFLLLVGMWFTARRALPGIWQQRWTFSAALARQFLRFGIYVGLATIFATIIYQFDNFLVGSFVSLESLGYYDRAYRIAQWSYILVGSVLARTAFYAYSRLQNDLPRLTRTAMMSIWIVTTLAFPIALAVFVSADNLVIVLFGERWLPSAQLLKFLVIYSILRPFLDDAGALFIAVGHPRRTTLLTVTQALALIIAATPLTLIYGAVGTALGVGIAFTVGLVVTYFFIRRTLPHLSLRDAFLVPALAFAMTLVLALPASNLIQMLPIPHWIALLMQIGLTMSLYLGITLVLRPRLTVERTRYVWRLFRQRAPLASLEELTL